MQRDVPCVAQNLPAKPHGAKRLLCSLAIVACVSRIAHAQSQLTPGPAAAIAGAPEKAYAFEVAAIRENRTTQREDLTQFGPTAAGYRAKNMSLQRIVMTAFAPSIGGGVFYTSDQIKEIPDWANSEHFDIEARVSEADRAEWQKPDAQKLMLRAMLQALLADRCKLIVHREVREVTVDSVVLAKGGPKFKESTPDEVFPPGIKLPWGGVVVPTRDGMRMYGVTMASFATVLAERTNSRRSIQDKTGLSGKYDITLKAEAPMTAAGGSAAVTASDFDAAMLASIDAVGLKMVSAKAPVEMLIIDHLERPSVN